MPALLAPLSWGVAVAGRLRRARTVTKHVPIPVICVGNLVAGGAGKTPTAIHIGTWLRERGHVVHYLTRGYGGKLLGPVLVQPERHTFYDIGDEAFLLAQVAPTWVSRDRAAGAVAAVAAGAEILVLDDGHQNPSLHKDLSIVVVDGGYMFGNGRLVPAGPLREPIAIGLERADAVIIVDNIGQKTVSNDVPWFDGIPFRARIVPTGEGNNYLNETVVAFAGIAQPEKLFVTLKALGANLLACHSFGDHHLFRPNEIMQLVEFARGNDARLVTTRKDAIRLPPNARQMVEILDIDLEFELPSALDEIIGPII